MIADCGDGVANSRKGRRSGRNALTSIVAGGKALSIFAFASLEELAAAFTPERLAACTGRSVGAVRASVGLANNDPDIRRALEVIASFAV